MSYGRDRDSMMRGVGAVAARDFGNARAQQRRRARSRALSERDRVLSRLTFGHGGGLGAINTGPLPDGSFPDLPDPEPRTPPRPLPYFPNPMPPTPAPKNTGIVPPSVVNAPQTSTTTSVLETAPSAKPNLLVVGAVVLAAILLTRKT